MLKRSFAVHRVVIVLAGLLAGPLAFSAQAFDPDADDGFAPLLVGGYPARWFGNGATIEKSLNLPNDSGMTFGGYSNAIDNSVTTWNNALSAKGIDFTLTLHDWTPVTPDTTGDDPLGDAPVVNSQTCIFKAYDTDGNYVCYVYDDTGAVVGQRTPGHGDCVETITQLCSLYVELALTGPADNPTSVQPVRDSNGFIQSFGNGKNEIYIEEHNYQASIEDYAADPDTTLALTVTRALVGGYNYAEIVEADILLNGKEIRVFKDGCLPFGCPETPVWRTPTISTSPTYCDKPGTAAADTTSVPAAAGGVPLCYVASGVSYENQYDIQNVVTHELGHFLGFGHPCDDVLSSDRNACNHAGEFPREVDDPIDAVSETTMFWITFEGQNTKRSLEPRDLDGLDQVFGEIIADSSGGGTGSSGGCSAGSSAALAPLLALLAGAFWLHLARRRPARQRVAGRQGRPMILPLLAALALGVSPAFATSVVPLSTADLVAQADLIVEAVVVDYQAKAGPKGAVRTDYELEVVDVFAGLPPPRLVVSVPGGRIGDTEVRIPGTPRFAPGERAFFFLKLLKGRWIVAGLSQGAKPVIRLPDGRTAVDAPKDSKVKSSTPVKAADSVMGLDEFRSQIRDLVKQLGESK